MSNDSALLRTYKLTIQTSKEGRALIIPEDNSTYSTLKIEVDVFQQTSTTYGTMTLRIYNLNATTASQTIEDQYLTQDPNIMLGQNSIQPYRKRIKLEIFSGRYGGVIFDGTVQKGTPPIKDNAGNLVTTIYATDGIYAIANCISNFSLKGEVKLSILITRLADDLKLAGIEVGAIDIPEALDITYKNIIVSGGTWEEIGKYTRTNLNSYIYKQKLYVVSYNTAFIATENILEADTGLLRVLDYTLTTVRVESIFNPLLQVGQSIEMKSIINTRINGLYKISEIRHNVSIGDGGQSRGITTIHCFKGITGQINSIQQPNSI